MTVSSSVSSPAGLSVEDVCLNFGGVHALSDVCITTDGNTIAGIIGPNGSGKTSLLNVISRLYTANQGHVTFQGHDLLRLPTHRVRALGISRSFQNVRLFDGLSVLDNLMMGEIYRWRVGAVRSLVATPAARRHERAVRKRASEVAEFLGIGSLLHRLCSGLAFGERKLVDTGRALMGDPKLLLLDEPTSGIPEDERGRVAEIVAKVPVDFQASVIVVDHDVEFIFGLSHTVFALDSGRVIASGSPADVRANEQLAAAYFGRDVDA